MLLLLWGSHQSSLLHHIPLVMQSHLAPSPTALAHSLAHALDRQSELGAVVLGKAAGLHSLDDFPQSHCTPGGLQRAFLLALFASELFFHSSPLFASLLVF